MRKILLMIMAINSILGIVGCSGPTTKEYTVSFFTDGGTEISDEKVKENECATEPIDPQKENHTFIEWQLDGERYEFDTPVTKNITLKALWTSSRYQNPVFEPVFADPSVIRHEGVYYAFGTQDQGDWGGTFGTCYGPIISSTDLVNWTYESSLFTTATTPLWGTNGAGIWAPDIVKIGDQFVVYYSLSAWGDPNPGIGVMIADHPLGPWEDLGKLFTSSEIGVNNSIDASVFKDDDGNLYMIWGSFRGLYGVELSSNGLSLKNGVDYARNNKVHIAGFDTSTGWNGATYEAPYIIKKGEWYYMFVSTGTCCQGHNSSYNVRVARSKNPLGPYLDHLDRDMRDANRGYQVIDKGENFVGVGHNGIAIDDAGNYYIVYHGFDLSENAMVGTSNRRSMLVDLLIWDKDGWPSVDGKVGSSDAAKPIINFK